MIVKDDKKEVIVKKDNYLNELKNSQEVCSLLMKTSHYAKMGQEGIFAIIETAKSLDIDPRQALGGGLYFVKGKVEMSARMMNALIRSKKHSITRDKRSDDQVCILHGKRADNGDGWSESFSLEEAKKAGLYRDNGPWKTFTRDMLFARALSRLARQLFPDIIGNCYVEGEISLDPNIKDNHIEEIPHQEDISGYERNEVGISDDEAKTLADLFEYCPQYRNKVFDFLETRGIEDLKDMPKDTYIKILEIAKSKVNKDINEVEVLNA